eukprot:scaffold157519_cov32-Prasinocladus_malaysianus.AAC.1
MLPLGYVPPDQLSAPRSAPAVRVHCPRGLYGPRQYKRHLRDSSVLWRHTVQLGIDPRPLPDSHWVIDVLSAAYLNSSIQCCPSFRHNHIASKIPSLLQSSERHSIAILGQKVCSECMMVMLPPATDS